MWTKGIQITTQFVVELEDGHKYLLERIIEIPDPDPKVQAINRFFSRLGDILTAGRRRSWFFEGIYSKTHFGWIGYNLIKDLMLDGKHTKKTRDQYRMTWDRMHAQIYRSEF